MAWDASDGFTKPLALVIDDSSIVRYSAAVLLEQLGFEVKIAANGLAGLTEARLNNFEVILMDVIMPVMDGLVATREFRRFEQSLNRHATIIGISDSAKPTQCLDVGMDAFLAKPLSLEALSQTIDFALSMQKRRY